jgi:uncharacterized protein (UPF0335 family)
MASKLRAVSESVERLELEAKKLKSEVESLKRQNISDSKSRDALNNPHVCV